MSDNPTAWTDFCPRIEKARAGSGLQAAAVVLRRSYFTCLAREIPGDRDLLRWASDKLGLGPVNVWPDRFNELILAHDPLEWTPEELYIVADLADIIEPWLSFSAACCRLIDLCGVLFGREHPMVVRMTAMIFPPIDPTPNRPTTARSYNARSHMQGR